MAAVASNPEFAPFLYADYDPNAFVHAVVNGQPYPPPPPPPPPSSAPDASAATLAGTSKDASAAAQRAAVASSPEQQRGTTSSHHHQQQQQQGVAAALFLKGDPGDVSAALAKLNFGVDDLQRQIKATVTTHHAALLAHASTLSTLDSSLSQVRRSLSDVDSGVQRLSRRIAVPHAELARALAKQARLRRAASLARRAARFIALARRLEALMRDLDDSPPSGAVSGGASTPVSESGPQQRRTTTTTTTTATATTTARERIMAEAALTLAEIETLLKTSTATTTSSTEQEQEPQQLDDDDDEMYDEQTEQLANGERAQPTDANGGGRGFATRRRASRPIKIVNGDAILPITALAPVAAHVPFVDSARARVVSEMEDAVARALNGSSSSTSSAARLDTALLASALQTAHNLSVLPRLVESVIQDTITLAVRRVKLAFDMASLAREMGAKDGGGGPAAFMYKSRMRTEPTNATWPQWTAAFWLRVETLVGELTSACVKVYTLERVLRMKKDNLTQTSFLDEAMATLDDKPSLMFWTSVAHMLETQTRDSTRSSTFIQNTMATAYPRLLRLFHDFFAKIAVHTDTVYTATQQSADTVLVLRSVSAYESLYLARSQNRLNEAVSLSFSSSSTSSSSTGTGAGGALSRSSAAAHASVPGANEGLGVARAIVNELDSARFDPLLSRAVARGAAKAVESFVARASAAAFTDPSSTSMVGPLATPAQQANADLASALYHLWSPLNRSLGGHVDPVREILKSSVSLVQSLRDRCVAIGMNIVMGLRREASTVIARMHRVDYATSVNTGGGASPYMEDLTDKLNFLKEEVFERFKVGDLGKEWAIDISRFVVQTFILHASFVRPLSEAGKLKLVSDTTALEFTVSQYLAAYAVPLANLGDQFKALRSFRPLLFLEDEQLTDPQQTGDVPVLVLLQHVLSRSSLPMPHQLHKWTESDYVRWLNEHAEEDRIRMVESALRHWEKKRKTKSPQAADGPGEGEESAPADKDEDDAGRDGMFVQSVKAIISRTRGA